MTKSLSFQPLAGLGIHLGMGVGSKGPAILNQSGNHNKSPDQGVSHSLSKPRAELSLEVTTSLGCSGLLLQNHIRGREIGQKGRPIKAAFRGSQGQQGRDTHCVYEPGKTTEEQKNNRI